MKRKKVLAESLDYFARKEVSYDLLGINTRFTGAHTHLLFLVNDLEIICEGPVPMKVITAVAARLDLFRLSTISDKRHTPVSIGKRLTDMTDKSRYSGPRGLLGKVKKKYGVKKATHYFLRPKGLAFLEEYHRRIRGYKRIISKNTVQQIDKAVKADWDAYNHREKLARRKYREKNKLLRHRVKQPEELWYVLLDGRILYTSTPPPGFSWHVKYGGKEEAEKWKKDNL